MFCHNEVQPSDRQWIQLMLCCECGLYAYTHCFPEIQQTNFKVYVRILLHKFNKIQVQAFPKNDILFLLNFECGILQRIEFYEKTIIQIIMIKIIWRKVRFESLFPLHCFSLKFLICCCLLRRKKLIQSSTSLV